MSYTSDHKRKFGDLAHNIKNQDQLRRKANGGNSILFSFPPAEEHLYISKARTLYAGKAVFIDVSRLLVQLIDAEGWESFKAYYSDYKDTPYQIFRSDDPAPDLFDMIINEIEAASQDDKIPFLVRTGCLFGTGIDNVNIMEHSAIMRLAQPLVVFYPSKIEGDNIYFLNFKPASRYRCILVQ